MGKHSNPPKRKTVKYLSFGLLFLILAGAAYVIATQALTEKQASVPATEKSSTAKSEKPRATSTTSSTTDSQTKSSSQTPQLDTAGLLANAETVYYGVHYFNSGNELSSQNSAPTVSASVIKVFIMEYALNQPQTDELIQGKSLNDWIVPMIQQSDNDATNVLIEHFGMEPLNQFFQAQGYQDTRLERKMLDTVARNQGKDNYTSLDDCMKFLKKLYQQQGSYPQSTMLDIMKGQNTRSKIPSKLPKDTAVANKTGELDDAENDIGLVLTEDNPFAIVVLTKNFTDVKSIQNAIGDFALSATKLK